MHSEGPGPGAKVRQAVARGRQAGVPGGLRGAGARRPGHGGPEEGPEEGTGAPPEQRPALARPSRPVVGGGCTSTAQEGDGVLPAAQGAVAGAGQAGNPREGQEGAEQGEADPAHRAADLGGSGKAGGGKLVEEERCARRGGGEEGQARPGDELWSLRGVRPGRQDCGQGSQVLEAERCGGDPRAVAGLCGRLREAEAPAGARDVRPARQEDGG
mmetsp:Transcript_2236/g.7474  ORF Transcript_2236/g.7474 Transcript_2236/m.7474 type:complete len:214 (+) Transcript_2236:1226-1867(+)